MFFVVGASNAQQVDTTSSLVVNPSVRQHDPNKALLLSIVPGLGQVYNHQAWKIPIIYGALGTCGYFVVDNYNSMVKYRDEYLYRQSHNGMPQMAEEVGTPTPNIYNMYESYNKNFQLSIIIGVALYGLNMVDAYVFGHLFDFEINDDLTLHCAPSTMMYNQGTSLGFAPSLAFTLSL